MTPDYAALLDRVPDVLAEASVQLTPGSSMPTRDQVTASRSSVTGADVRLDFIDDVLRLLTAAVDAAVALTTAYAELEPVRVDDWEPTPPRVLATDDEDAVLAAAAPLLATLREHLDDLTAHPAGYLALDHLNDLAKLIRERRARTTPTGLCRTCGEVAVVAALDRGVGACPVCGKQIGPDAWLDVADTARQLGCSVKTLRRMIAAGEVESRGEGSARELRLASVIAARQLREARMKLGI